MYKVNIQHEVTQEQIEDLITCAIEGGSNYWYRIESDTKGDYSKTALTVKGLVISNHMVLDEDKPRQGVLNIDSIASALRLMASKHPNAINDVITGNADAYTGDIFLQLAVFGEVLYG